MPHSHLEMYIIALFEIHFFIDVEIHLGQTIYASQGFKMQGTQFLTQNFLNPLPFDPNTKMPCTLFTKFTKLVFQFPRVVEIHFMQNLHQTVCFQT